MIIAEFCQNHGGLWSICSKMIDEAKRAGVFGCKIQTFFGDDLSAKWMDMPDKYDYYKGAELTFSNQAAFVEKCKAFGLVPITSVYSSKYLKMLKEIGFLYIKIGSADALNSSLISDCVDIGFKPMVSLNSYSFDKFEYIDGIHALFYCVSIYPTPFDSFDFRMFQKMREKFPVPHIGFSDHSDSAGGETFSNAASRIALEVGVDYIERHFTTRPKEGVKDGRVSLYPYQMEDLCRYEREVIKKRSKYFEVVEKEKIVMLQYGQRWAKPGEEVVIKNKGNVFGHLNKIGKDL